mgnify:CR=1 FL=1
MDRMLKMNIGKVIGKWLFIWNSYKFSPQNKKKAKHDVNKNDDYRFYDFFSNDM